MQENEHRPDTQVPDPWATSGHTIPQPPQLFRDVCVLTQLVPQRVVPGPHAVTQALAVQVCPLAHARPHAPQCAALVRVSTSQPLAAIPSQSA